MRKILTGMQYGESAITIKKDGWYVEMKIPYSAIRFPNMEAQEWGLKYLQKN